MITTTNSYLRGIIYHLAECSHPSAFQGIAPRRCTNWHEKVETLHVHTPPFPVSLLSSEGELVPAKGQVGTQKERRGALLELLAFLS